MKQSNKIVNTLVTICIIIITLIYPISFMNAGIYRTCNDKPVILEGDPITRISTISFPVGTRARQDLENAITRWNNLRGMTLEFEPVVNFSGNYEFGNGRNEIVFKDISSLGRTTTQFDACSWWFEGQSIQEFDIEMNVNTNWQYGAPTQNSNAGRNSFRYTAVHELGHALGLLDNNDSSIPSIMKQSLKGQCWCGSGTNTRVHPLPDDTRTSRMLYPHSNTHRDIMACAFEVDSSTKEVEETMVNTTINVQRGRTFQVRGSFGNLGNRTENFDIAFVLSTNDIISTSDRVIASGTGTSSSGGFRTFSWNARVSNNIARGTYFLGMIVDPNNNISERIENNNVVLLRSRVRVI